MAVEIKKNSEIKMQKAVANYRAILAKIRTGRAHTGILEHLQINYYGALMPITQVATITASDSQTVVVTPWDVKMVGIIEKAIRDSDLGLNPVASGTVVRVPMPPLTEERRRELIKIVKAEGENSKVVIRNIRRDSNTDLKIKLRDKLITEDEEKRGQDDIQKMTDKFIAEIDKVTAEKEKELLTV